MAIRRGGDGKFVYKDGDEPNAQLTLPFPGGDT